MRDGQMFILLCVYVCAFVYAYVCLCVTKQGFCTIYFSIFRFLSATVGLTVTP